MHSFDDLYKKVVGLRGFYKNRSDLLAYGSVWKTVARRAAEGM